MRTYTETTVAYTAAELQVEHPNGFAAALDNYRDFLWEAGLMTEDLEGYILPSVLTNAGCPSLETAPLRWDFGFSQGDGVSFDDFDLDDDNFRELGITLPEGLTGADFGVRRDTGYIGNNYTHEYTFAVEYIGDYDISDELRLAAAAVTEETTDKLRDLCREMYRVGSDFVLDEDGLTERFLDGNDSIYDEYGDCLGDITDLDNYNTDKE